MNIFTSPDKFLSIAEQKAIVEAIRSAEHITSGEIRIFIETKCKYIDAIDRAAEVFYNLKMDKTENRNAVLIYIAIKDKQLSIFGDEGIYLKTGNLFWKTEVDKMILSFKQHEFVNGIINIIAQIGLALHLHFPYDRNTDKNELPDDIVFGH